MQYDPAMPSPRRAGHSAAALLLLLSAACGRAERPDEPGATPAALPGFAAAQPLVLPVSEPGISPQLIASARGVTLSWVAPSGDASTLRWSEWNGSAWTAPATVTKGANWFLSWADAPSVVRLRTGTLVANWYETTRSEIEAYDMRLSYSTDDGKTWARPFTPHGDKTETQHGFASFVDLPDGVGLVWLDGRDMANNTTDPEGGVMSLRFTRFDRQWKQAADVEVDRRVCECCQTAAVVTDDGVVTAFRDRSDKEMRDIATSRLENGSWTQAALVHADNYETFACPVNGPALSARGRDVAVAWYTVANETGRSYAAFSRDAGRTWSSPVRLDDGQSLGLVDVALLDDGTAAATWVEFANDARHFRMRRVHPDGRRSDAQDVAASAAGRISGYPRMERFGDGLLFAWLERGDGQDEGPGGQTLRAARLPLE